MKAAFDDTAMVYDSEFTRTPIGKLQRARVWNYLIGSFKDDFPKQVLELNCGTGEDAIFFARHQSNVLATDVSASMLDVAIEKIRTNGFSDQITTRKLDILKISNEAFDQKFDLVFSNFGGLNCIDPIHLSALFTKMPAILNPGGRMILVVMPRFCVWESIYFLSKLNVAKAFRRRKKDAQFASLGRSGVNIWYYDPLQLRQLAKAYFKISHIQPIGIAIPPSYFNKTFLNNQKILGKLNAAEKKLNKFKPLSRLADHYLIDLELK